jgi:hypothetical protein
VADVSRRLACRRTDSCSRPSRSSCSRTACEVARITTQYGGADLDVLYPRRLRPSSQMLRFLLFGWASLAAPIPVRPDRRTQPPGRPGEPASHGSGGFRAGRPDREPSHPPAKATTKALMTGPTADRPSVRRVSRERGEAGARLHPRAAGLQHPGAGLPAPHTLAAVKQNGHPPDHHAPRLGPREPRCMGGAATCARSASPSGGS